MRRREPPPARAHDDHVRRFDLEAQRYLVHMTQMGSYDDLPPRARWVNAYVAEPQHLEGVPEGAVITIARPAGKERGYALRIFWDAGCMLLAVSPEAPPPPGGLSRVTST